MSDVKAEVEAKVQSVLDRVVAFVRANALKAIGIAAVVGAVVSAVVF